MFSRIGKAIKAFQERKFCIIFGEGEGEADLACPADGITAAAVLTMARVASGLLCLALPKSRLKQLEIEALLSRYRVQDTPFYESVDAIGAGSGVSARDRALTIRKMIDPNTRPEDLARPGHVALLGAHADGLIGRDGHTEAVVELCQLAGLYPGGVLCELVGDDGDMMNAEELKVLANRFKIPIITVGTLAKVARSLLPKGGRRKDLTRKIK